MWIGPARGQSRVNQESGEKIFVNRLKRDLVKKIQKVEFGSVHSPVAWSVAQSSPVTPRTERVAQAA